MERTVKIYLAGKLSTAGQLMYNNFLATRLMQLSNKYNCNTEIFLPQYVVKNEFSNDAIWKQNFEKLKLANFMVVVLDGDGQGTFIEIGYWLYQTNYKMAIISTEKGERPISPIWNIVDQKYRDRIIFLPYNYMLKMKELEKNNEKMTTDTDTYTSLMCSVLDEKVEMIYNFIIK